MYRHHNSLKKNKNKKNHIQYEGNLSWRNADFSACRHPPKTKNTYIQTYIHGPKKKKINNGKQYTKFQR